MSVWLGVGYPQRIARRNPASGDRVDLWAGAARLGVDYCRREHRSRANRVRAPVPGPLRKGICPPAITQETSCPNRTTTKPESKRS